MLEFWESMKLVAPWIVIILVWVYIARQIRHWKLKDFRAWPWSPKKKDEDV